MEKALHHKEIVLNNEVEEEKGAGFKGRLDGPQWINKNAEYGATTQGRRYAWNQANKRALFGKTRKLSMRFHCQKEKSLEKERYNGGGIESFENDCQKIAKLRWKHEYSWSQWQRAEGRGGVSVNNLRRVCR